MADGAVLDEGPVLDDGVPEGPDWADGSDVGALSEGVGSANVGDGGGPFRVVVSVDDGAGLN